jgi:hypothetical protein
MHPKLAASFITGRGYEYEYGLIMDEFGQESRPHSFMYVFLEMST